MHVYLAGTLVGRKRGATQVKLQNTCTRAHHQRIQEQLQARQEVNPMWFRHGGLQNNVITGGKYPYVSRIHSLASFRPILNLITWKLIPKRDCIDA